MRIGRKYVSWNTPVSDENFLLVDMQYEDCCLKLSLDPSIDGFNKKKTKITFSKVASFKITSERYMNYMWNEISESGACGRTLFVENSEWIQNLSSSDGLFALFEKNPTHYLILTDNEVIDVLSSNYPEII